MFSAHLFLHLHLCALFMLGCTIVCGEKAGEAAGGWCGVCFGVHGQTGESSPHRGL